MLIKQRDEFIITMTKEYPEQVTRELLAGLLNATKGFTRLQVIKCNRSLVPAEIKWEKIFRDRLYRICSNFPDCQPIIKCDPRGCCVKLKVKSGRTDDFAREGICIPV